MTSVQQLEIAHLMLKQAGWANTLRNGGASLKSFQRAFPSRSSFSLESMHGVGAPLAPSWSAKANAKTMAGSNNFSQQGPMRSLRGDLAMRGNVGHPTQVSSGIPRMGITGQPWENKGLYQKVLPKRMAQPAPNLP